MFASTCTRCNVRNRTQRTPQLPLCRRQCTRPNAGENVDTDSCYIKSWRHFESRDLSWLAASRSSVLLLSRCKVNFSMVCCLFDGQWHSNSDLQAFGTVSIAESAKNRPEFRFRIPVEAICQLRTIKNADLDSRRSTRSM